MQEEAPPPIVRTRYVIVYFLYKKKKFLFIRVIKVDRPIRSGYSQPGSPYGNPCNGLSSFSNGVVSTGNGYRAQSIVGSVGRPSVYHNTLDNNPSFSSASSFEYIPPGSMGQPKMMMMPTPQQTQPMGMMQQQQQVQQQMMYRPVQMQSSYIPQNYMYPVRQQGMSFGYPQMMQPGRMMPNRMPMMAAGNTIASPSNHFPNQLSLFNPMAQQMVY
jgi:hypothetical protein